MLAIPVKNSYSLWFHSCL